jgi:hypothetical protein
MLLLPAIAGCYGGTQGDPSTDTDATGTAGDGSGDETADGPGGNDGVPDGTDPDSVPQPLAVRLTDAQYRFTIADVLGLQLDDEEAGWLPKDVPVEGEYSTSAQTQFFNTQYVLAYAYIARSLSERIDAPALLAQHGGCDLADDGCTEAFVTSLGLRLFRRPLTPEEVQAFVALGEAIADGPDTTSADVQRGLLQALLQSPQFLYRLEHETAGEPGTLRVVTGYELATRLSYFLWQSAPDDALLAFAAGPNDDGEFDVSALPEQIDRMIADPRFARSRTLFWGDYSLASVASFGTVDATLGAELRDSLLATLDRISGVGAPAQPLSTIFDGQQIVMTPGVAELAGAPSLGAGLQTYDVADAEQRLGVVTHPGFLAAIGTTSFVGRGVFMTERLLCQHIVPPPDNVADQIMNTAMATAGMTPREASEFRFGLEPVCLGCHTQFEPIAYGFERYDDTGRYTLTDDQGRDLFSDGMLPKFGDREAIPFADGLQLLAELGASPVVQRCFVENMTQFAAGARPEDADAFLDAAQVDFDAAGSTYDALVEAVAASPRMTLLRHAEVE